MLPLATPKKCPNIQIRCMFGHPGQGVARLTAPAVAYTCHNILHDTYWRHKTRYLTHARTTGFANV